jgi:2-methylcitrate dehydratase PrpD
MASASHRLSAFIAALKYDDLPHVVVEAAEQHALDVLGCGLAALALDGAPWVAAGAREVASSGPATAIGFPEGLPAGEAAMVNGTLCHALDFDDTHTSLVHVSAAVVPAALAAAEIHGASGRELVCALVAGNETSSRLGAAGVGLFHARGFHPTGVCGAFGAAAAASRLRGLDAEQTANALGLAASMSSGLMEFLADGSKTKPLHPGWAAQAGLTAARLAAYGATGPATAIEGRRGFFGAYLHGERVDVAGQLDDLGERWETPRIGFKPYPACHANHAALDALTALVTAEGLEAGDVESIVVQTNRTGSELVLEPLEDKVRPRTPYDAKFSLPYCLAELLVHGHVGVESFTEAAIADSAVLDVAARVRGEVAAFPPGSGALPARLVVRTRDGRTLVAEQLQLRGGAELPMSADEVVAKWRANASLTLPEGDVMALEGALLALDALPDAGALGVLASAAPMHQLTAG